MNLHARLADVDPPRPLVLLRWQCGRLVASEFATSAIRADGVSVAIAALRGDRMAWVAPEDVDAVRMGVRGE